MRDWSSTQTYSTGQIGKGGNDERTGQIRQNKHKAIQNEAELENRCRYYRLACQAGE